LYPFLGAIAFYMLLDATSLRGWWSWPLKLLFTIGWIGYWFQRELFSSGAWWMTAARLAVEDAVSIAGGVWLVSPEMRTFLFLAGWSALVYAVHRITVDRGQALWFVFSTMSFLVLLQLWPGLDTGAGVLRTAAMGLLLLTVQHGAKWERLLGSRFTEGRSVAMMRLGVGILCGLLVLGSGYGLSAGASSDVKPVSLKRWTDWIESAAERRWSASSASSAVQMPITATTGYGGNSSRLGRPVTPDEGIAFEAVTERPTYWRGSTLDVYTGQGWRSSALTDRAEVFRSVRPPDGAPETVTQTITVVDESLQMNVFAGGSIMRFYALSDAFGHRLSDIHIRFDPEKDAYYVGTNTVRLGSYRMETLPAVAEPEVLLLDNGKMPIDPAERYLQLPESVTDRVRALAESIVADVPNNRYLQAAAIESYLRKQYTYTMETTLPPAGADFVDHFLFETREGYCDHFSTAMVVLLRSIGIEARWAKGFAPGTQDPERPDTYVVQHADAHSWVEVRFADAGWVPFEPTPSVAFAAAASERRALPDPASTAADAPAALQALGALAPVVAWLGDAAAAPSPQ
jgi:transglutaminase-like putative cysteine protease